MNLSSRYSPTLGAAVNPLGLGGMVSTPHYLATRAGSDILAQGGSAVDAAIAAGAVLSVVYPHMCGLGGDGFWLIYNARKGELRALNASGRAARGASREMYAMRGFKSVPTRGFFAVNTVPGAVSGWDEAHRYSQAELGSRVSWASLLDAAIGHAENGFPVGPSLAHWLKVDTSGDGPGRALHQYRAFLDIYCKDMRGTPYGLGEILRQEDLAESLRKIAENGAAEFYEGSIARAIADSMMLHAGLLTVGDLDSHKSDWEEPIGVAYRGCEAMSAPPPCQGMTTLEILGILNSLDIAALGEGSADYYQVMAEACRLALADRNAHLADPAQREVPVSDLLDPARTAKLAAGIRAGRDRKPVPRLSAGGDTVWVGVVDASGNSVSMLQSLYHDFGSGMVASGTGIVLQNRGSSFSLDEKAVNALEPGARPMHTLSPCMLMKDGRPALVLGSMGGDGQPQTVSCLVTRILDFGMAPQDAVNAPRWLLGKAWGDEESSLKLEARVGREVLEDLAARGLDVQKVDDFAEIMGHAGAILCDENGVRQGAADPRGDGQVIAG